MVRSKGTARGRGVNHLNPHFPQPIGQDDVVVDISSSDDEDINKKEAVPRPYIYSVTAQPCCERDGNDSINALGKHILLAILPLNGLWTPSAEPQLRTAPPADSKFAIASPRNSGLTRGTKPHLLLWWGDVVPSEERTRSHGRGRSNGRGRGRGQAGTPETHSTMRDIFCCALDGDVFVGANLTGQAISWLVSADLAIVEAVVNDVDTKPSAIRIHIARALFGRVEGSLPLNEVKLRQSSAHIRRVLICEQILTTNATSGGNGVGADASSAGSDAGRSAQIVSPALLPSTWSTAPLDRGAARQLAEQDIYAAACPLVGEDSEGQGSWMSQECTARMRLILRPQLRQYQQRGLNWMLRREAGISAGSCLALQTQVTDENGENAELHPLWMQCRSADGTVLFYASSYFGALSLVPVPPAVTTLRSGIFADEMGLGKTVVTLALVASTDWTKCPSDAEPDAAVDPALAKRRILSLCQVNADAEQPLPSLHSSLARDSDVACICGATYSTSSPLIDPDRLAQAGPQQRRKLIEGAVADNLLWIQCGACQRWQHALCGGLEETDTLPSFVCTECQAIGGAGKPLQSNATLVICPVPILRQWQSEIAKHAVICPDIYNLSAGSGTTSASSASSAIPVGLRVVYYAGVRATLSAMRECTSAASRYCSLIPVLEERVQRLREALSPLALASYDETAKTDVIEGTNQTAILQSAVSAADKAGGLAVVDGALVIDGELFDFGLQNEDDKMTGTLDVDIVHRISEVTDRKFCKSATDTELQEEGVDLDELSDDGFTRRTKKPRLSAGVVPLQQRRVDNIVRRHMDPTDAVVDLARLDARHTLLKKKLRAAQCAAIRLARTLSPLYLAAADLVITTYGALESDIHHADSVSVPALAGASQLRVIADQAQAMGIFSGTDDREAFIRIRLKMMMRNEPGWNVMPAFSAQPSVFPSKSSETRRRMVIESDDEEGIHANITSSSPVVSVSAGKKRQRNSLAGLGVVVDSTTGAIKSVDKSGRGIFALHDDLSALASGGRKLRTSKKYRVVPTPLLAVHFHRAALDECQMIDAPAAKAALMARRLHATFRWAISGTPLKRSLEDLHGLLLFLGVHPYGDKDVFYKALLAPAEAGDARARLTLLKLAHDIMWRTRKEDVSSELGLPPLMQETLNVRFSRIEEAFYRSHFARLLAKIEPVLSDWRAQERLEMTKRTNAGRMDSSSSSASIEGWLLGDHQLTKRESDRIVGPLLRLRQACVHPQIGVHGIGRRDQKGEGNYKPGARGGILSMAAVLDAMLTKAKLDAEDRLRDVVASHNGLAGFAWLAADFDGAASHYQMVQTLAQDDSSPQSAKQNAGGSRLADLSIRVDAMQRIHSLRNHAELLRELSATNNASSSASDAAQTKSLLHADRLERQAGGLEMEVVRTAATIVQADLGKVRRETMPPLLELLFVQATEQKEELSYSSEYSASLNQIPDTNLRLGVAVGKSEVDAILGALLTSAPALDDCLALLVDELMKRVRHDQSRSAAIVEAATNLIGYSDEIGAKDLKALTSSAPTAIIWHAETVEAVRFLTFAALQELVKLRQSALASARAMMRPNAEQIAASAMCRVCKGDWGRDGEVCGHCASLRHLISYRSILMAAREQMMSEESIAKKKVFSAAGRLQRAKTKLVPGAEGQLSTWLNTEDAGVVNFDDSGKAAGSDGRFLTATALVRTLQALAKECKGVKVDIGELISSRLSAFWAASSVDITFPERSGAGAPSSHSATQTTQFQPSHPGQNAAFAVRFSYAPPANLTAIVDVGQWLDAALSSLQGEAQALIGLHRVQADLLSVMDEVDASLTRMALAPPGKKLTDAETLYLTTPGELPERRRTLQLQLAGHEADLSKARGHLAYLVNIQKEEGKTGSHTLLGSKTDAIEVDSEDVANAIFQCVICRDTLGESDSGNISVIKVCAHRFCRSCLLAFIKSTSVRHEDFGKMALRCPQCRSAFSSRDIALASTKQASSDVKVVSANQAFSTPSEGASSLTGAGTSAEVLAGSDVFLQVPALVDDNMDNATLVTAGCLSGLTNDVQATSVARLDARFAVAGSFGAKVETLIMCLKALAAGWGPSSSSHNEAAGASCSSGNRSEVPAHKNIVKSLIFSQWDEGLAVVEAACVRNGIRVHRVTSARQASEVKEAFGADPKSTALLLPLQVGAEGINIPEATHVFFLEPTLRPAIEEQAIGRIWRMGQTRPTFAHRLIVSGTVEGAVAALNHQRFRRMKRYKEQISLSRAPQHRTSECAGALAMEEVESGVEVGDPESVMEHLQALVANTLSAAGDGSDLGAVDNGDTALSKVRSGGDTAGVRRLDILRLFQVDSLPVAS